MKLFCRVICFLSFVSVCAAQDFYWDCDGENFNIMQGQTQVGFVEGLIGNCVVIDNQNVALKQTENKYNTSATISFWLKANGLPKDTVLISKDGKKAGWKVSIYKNGKSTCFTLRTKNKSTYCSGSLNINDNIWHNVTVVFDDETASLYVDGALDNCVNLRGVASVSDKAVVLGAVKSGKASASNKFMLDEINLFAKVLTNDEVFNLSNANTKYGNELVKTFNSLNVIPIQLHRGGGMYLPENTLETFNKAWNMRVIPEADIRTSSDDVIVCIHDYNFKRLSPSAPKALQAKRVEELTLSQLKTVDVGAFRKSPNEKIPTLQEVFQAMHDSRDRYIFLDYKDVSLERLANLVKKYSIEKQIIFTSRHHNLLCDWKKLVPESPTMIWLSGNQPVVENKYKYLKARNFDSVNILQIHYRNAVYKDGKIVTGVTDDFIRQCNDELASQGVLLQVLPWMIDDSAVFNKLRKIGVKSFATDYPDAALAK